MERLLITRRELQDWLTAEIQKDEDCQSCEVRGISKLQELVASVLGIEPGYYFHFVTNLHIYKRHFKLKENHGKN